MAFTMCVSAWAASVRVTGTHVRLRLNPSLNAAIYTDSYGTPIFHQRGKCSHGLATIPTASTK